jgi:hypothetical protein
MLKRSASQRSAARSERCDDGRIGRSPNAGFVE